MRRLVLLGPPGVGKGTQGVRLAAALRIPTISTGDLFRSEIHEQTPLGVRLQAVVASGELVPDALTNTLVRQRLQQPDVEDGFILDGYPRTADQVGELDGMLQQIGAAVDAAVLLEAPDPVLVQRLLVRAEQNGRTDDTPDVIHRRLAVYQRQTAPLAEIYAADGRLHRVDGIGTTDEVHARLLAALGRSASPHAADPE